MNPQPLLAGWTPLLGAGKVLPKQEHCQNRYCWSKRGRHVLHWEYFIFKIGPKCPTCEHNLWMKLDPGWDGGNSKCFSLHLLVLAHCHYRLGRHSLRAKRGSGVSWQPRRVWHGTDIRKNIRQERHLVPWLFPHNSKLFSLHLKMSKKIGSSIGCGDLEKNYFLFWALIYHHG